jgi:hypothetical protein
MPTDHSAEHTESPLEPRRNDLEHALHTVEQEIQRYETIITTNPAQSEVLAPDLKRFKTYREEIQAKLKAEA